MGELTEQLRDFEIITRRSSGVPAERINDPISLNRQIVNGSGFFVHFLAAGDTDRAKEIAFSVLKDAFPGVSADALMKGQAELLVECWGELPDVDKKSFSKTLQKNMGILVNKYG
ncbi:hypothetical protein HY086_06860 [Candidatus Gottesmanbacteria bacterium]|nr:hypothetical protein [Candidatus Gottesmanbacteria bacterium]